MYLILKRASASRPSGEWNADDFDVVEDGTVVGRIFKAHAAPVGSPWMWTLIKHYYVHWRHRTGQSDHLLPSRDYHVHQRDK